MYCVKASIVEEWLQSWRIPPKISEQKARLTEVPAWKASKLLFLVKSLF